MTQFSKSDLFVELANRIAASPARPVQPETPDFEQLAYAIVYGVGGDPRTGNTPYVAEQLRLVWNARWVADVAVIDDVAHTNDVAVANAIRSLDR